MNILLTNSCNRRCPYCFAQERISYSDDHQGIAQVATKAPPRISRADFRYAIDFAAGNGQKMVGILGGEPSTHPEFIDLLKEAWSKGLITTIFTNGMWKESLIEQFESCDRKHTSMANIIVNINEPDITSDKEHRGQMRLLSKLGRYCAISFNIYRDEFDPLFLVDIIERFKCRKHIRLGVAVPLANHDSQYVSIERYSHIAKTILALAERCDENDITLGFDCGFITCMFNAEELGRLHLYGANFVSKCGSPIDIGTDLSVWACFPLSTFAKGQHLKDFNNIKELKDSFDKQFGRLYKAGALDDCVDCKYRRRRQCSGGCAAHVYRRFNQ